MTDELAAFRSVDFDWARQLQSVWHDPVFDVDLLHRSVADDILEDFRRLAHRRSSPPGRVIVGPAGSGKTHLVGNLRRRVWEAGGWFVLLDIVGITDFWRTAALGFINSLHQIMPDGEPQYTHVFLGVLRSLPGSAVQAVIEEAGGFQRGDRVQLADRFVGLLHAAHPAVAMQHRDVVRAFILLRDESAINSAYSWLQGLDIGEEERERLRFAAPPPHPAELVRGMSWFMSLAGPTMIAADQLDAIVTAANLSAGSALDSTDDDELKARAIIETLAGGLMELKEVTARSISIVTCLVETWQILRSRALKPAIERFSEPTALHPPRNDEIVSRIVGDRLAAAYSEVGFQPPYPTWPFTLSAINSAVGLSPRTILMRCDAHRRRCIAEGRVTECDSLSESSGPGAPAPPTGLDHRFAEALKQAEVSELLLPDDDHKALRGLLTDVLSLYVHQTAVPEDVDLVVRRDPDERKPTLHGRLVFVFHGEQDREQHFCFRVLAQSNAIAFQARLRAAMTASGIDAKLAFRHLFVIRSDPPPKGRVTSKLVDEFQAAGGRFIRPSEEDLRALAALRDMYREALEGFEDWLRSRKPLCDIPFFKEAGLCPPPLRKGAPSDQPRESPVSGPEESAPRPGRNLARSNSEGMASLPSASSVADGGIPIGRRLEAGREGPPESIPTKLLPKHTVIIAGSGSGKTVLLRRIVEEAALLDIPSIVLDPNNDLARLGDAWPDDPSPLTEEDIGKAAAYREKVEVIVWTPGLPSGRPLSLSLLPDFTSLEDENERGQAVQMALATLLPFVGATGARGALKEGVLAEALRDFARRGDCALADLIALLSELPDGVSQIDNAEKLAREMANRLKAALATNPMLNAQGQSLDPAVLFTGDSGKTRISVLNLTGLPGDAARQSFVNQLQMTLFTWIRRHPSPTGRLYVMDEAQNFAPSGKSTPASESTRALAAQARKYGLGMIFATQVPKGIDNKIISNCTTHFYGRQSAPATIDAAREMMAAKGGGGEDIGRLGGGQFFYSTEGLNRPVKLKSPLCLSHHPPNPLSPEEVERRARGSLQAADAPRAEHSRA